MHMAAVLPVLFLTVGNFLTLLKITCKEENLFPFYIWQRRTRPTCRHRWEDHCGPLFLLQWVHWRYPPRRSQFRPVSGVHNHREAMHELQGGYRNFFFRCLSYFENCCDKLENSSTQLQLPSFSTPDLYLQVLFRNQVLILYKLFFCFQSFNYSLSFPPNCLASFQEVAGSSLHEALFSGFLSVVSVACGQPRPQNT